MLLTLTYRTHPHTPPKAMAAGDNGLVVTVEVVRVTLSISQRRLSQVEVAVGNAKAAYKSIVELVMGLGVTEEIVKSVAFTASVDSLKDVIGSSVGKSGPPFDPNHRALAASQVTVDYKMSVAVDDNPGVGDAIAITVRPHSLGLRGTHSNTLERSQLYTLTCVNLI